MIIMKEYNKKKLLYLLRQFYKEQLKKHELLEHKIFVWKQYKEDKDMQIKLGRKVDQECLDNMFEICRLIEWVEKL